jgi:hypothetical protein
MLNAKPDSETDHHQDLADGVPLGPQKKKTEQGKYGRRGTTPAVLASSNRQQIE